MCITISRPSRCPNRSLGGFRLPIGELRLPGLRAGKFATLNDEHAVDQDVRNALRFHRTWHSTDSLRSVTFCLGTLLTMILSAIMKIHLFLLWDGSDKLQLITPQRKEIVFRDVHRL